LEAAEPDRLLKPGEVRSEFGVSDTTLREWDRSGKLPAAQRTFGGHRRYRESDVRALLAGLVSPGRPDAATPVEAAA
jgi:excisionase family DNA binding protein